MDPGTLIAFLVILVLSGFFSGTETALTAVSDVSIHQLVEKGDKRAKIVEHMLRDRRRVISTLLIANNIVNVVLAVLASLVFGEMLAGVGPAWLGPVVASAGAIIALLIFGEVVPKTMAISFSTRWSLFSAYPTVVLVVIFRPLAWALTVMSHGMMRLTGRKGGAGDDDVLTVGHIQTFAKIGASEGVIDSLETELIHRAAELNDSRVREIMIPRTDIFAVESGSDLASIKAMFQTTPLSRIPVYRGDLDEIIGVLNYKEVLRMGATVSQRFNLRSYLHPPMFVPESMFIGDLLNEMRTKKTHLAIVCDEYGGTSGLVTLEDVMEMLVGKIEDEYDVEANLFEALDQTSWAVDG
ncbi:MAG: hemolysin family protein, partial [Nitrospira sp.]|nr:hemolysin family protein [Nitrospira sp.]